MMPKERKLLLAPERFRVNDGAMFLQTMATALYVLCYFLKSYNIHNVWCM